MTDRKKLEAAIDWFRQALKMGGGWRPDFDAAGTVVLEAAEAHLASLPKPTWKVLVYSAGPMECREWPTQQEALIDANGYLSRGARTVEIEAP